MDRLQKIKNFPMKRLNRSRTIWIYLPATYDTKKKFPVLYMQDGQNLFQKETSAYGTCWNIRKTLEEVNDLQGIGEIIIVGIESDSQKRYLEYSPWENKEIAELMPHAAKTDGLGGEGFSYLTFIVEELKPYIDKNYCTLPEREHTSIAGSSMGGLISVVAGLVYQEVFSKVGSFSSAAYFCEKDFFDFLSKTKMEHPVTWYLDVGTEETSNQEVAEFPEIYQHTTRKIYEGLTHIGWEEVAYNIWEGDYHSEECWERRFPIMLQYFQGKTL